MWRSWIRRSLKSTSLHESQCAVAEIKNTTASDRLAQAVRRWAEDQNERDLTERHHADIRRIAKALGASFGALLVSEVRRGALLEWLRLRPRKLRQTRAFFRWAIAEDLRATVRCPAGATYMERPEGMQRPGRPTTRSRRF